MMQTYPPFETDSEMENRESSDSTSSSFDLVELCGE